MTAPESWCWRRWNEFWLRPGSATDLAVGRVLFFAFLLFLYHERSPTAWGHVPEVFWWPTPLFDLLGIGVAPASWLHGLDVAWKFSLLLACLGLLTRWSTALAFLLGFYLLGLPHNFGKIHHGDAALVLVLGILAVSRCGDAWSLDRLRVRFRRAADRSVNGPGDGSRSPEYGWPVRLIQVVFCSIYFAAGLQKLWTAGLDWVVTDNMRYMLIRHHYTHAPAVDWGLWLAEISAVPELLAAGTLLLELGVPLALFSRRAALVILPALLLMQIGIGLLLGFWFTTFVALYLFWIPWSELTANQNVEVLRSKFEVMVPRPG